MWPLAEEKAIAPVGSIDVVDSSEFVDLPSSGIEVQQLTPEEEWLQNVYQLVEKHFQDPDFGTSSAAKMLYMSERSLQRRFKSAAKRTFKDYVIEVRLEMACESLLAGVKISDVAFNSGFNDPSYFSQKFKHHFGVPPSQFTRIDSE